MVDVETTGTDSSHNAIIQIAAVRFDIETGVIQSAFVGSLDVPPNRFWDEDTRSWWMSKLDVYSDIVADARPPQEVMDRFADWCVNTAPFAGDQRFWAKPISFDWPFIQSYAKQFKVGLPFFYRNAVDLNSYIRGVSRNPEHWNLEKKIPFTGSAHNALDDVVHQVKVAVSAAKTERVA